MTSASLVGSKHALSAAVEAIGIDGVALLRYLQIRHVQPFGPPSAQGCRDRRRRQSSLSVSATATWLSWGQRSQTGAVNPVSGGRVIDAEACRFTLAVMATAGLYKTSGD